MKSIRIISLIMFLCLSGNIYAQRGDVIEQNGYYIVYEKDHYTTSTSGLFCESSYFALWLHVFVPGVSGSAGPFDSSKSTQSYSLYNQPSSFRLVGNVGTNGNWVQETQDISYTKGKAPFTMEISRSYDTGCTRKLSAKYKVTVYDPAVITSTLFNNGYNHACVETPITINVGAYYNGNGRNAVLQIWSKRGQWETIESVTGNSSKTYTYAQLSNYINYNQAFHFRTKTLLHDNTYSCSTFPSSPNLYYHQEVKLPEGKEIKITPDCDGTANLLVPYEGSTNYVLTLTGDNNANYLTSNLAQENNYYIIPNLSAGSYTLKVEYINNGESGLCFQSIPVNVPTFPVFSISEPTYPQSTNDYQITTPGGTGEVSFVVSGSRNQTVTVHTDEGDSLQTMTNITSRTIGEFTFYDGTVTVNLHANNHTVYVSNADCNSNAQNIELQEPESITFIPTPVPPSCNTTNLVSGNTTNGKIEITAIQGGIGTYKYKVNEGNFEDLLPGQDNVTISGNYPAGDYTVTIADTYGNTSTQNLTIEDPAPITINIDSYTAPSLACTKDGSVTISATKGSIEPFLYSKTTNRWEFGRDNTLTGYASGNAIVYVLDTICDCIVQKVVNIPSTAGLEISKRDSVPPTCPEGEDGIFTFVFKHRQGNLSANSLDGCAVHIDGDTIRFTGKAGHYFYDIIDTKGNQPCSVSVDFTILDKQGMTLNATPVRVSDKGSATGSISGEISGGNSGNYTVSLYDENNNRIGQPQITASNYTFAGLTGKFEGQRYKIKAMDSKGCVDSTELQVFEPAIALQLSATLTKPVSCYGESDAKITLSATGGWEESPYQYSKDNQEWRTIAVFDTLSAGNHTFYVKDKYNGTHSIVKTIEQPNPLTITLDSLAPVLCYGAETGLLRYRVSGGTYPYTVTSLTGTVTESITANDTLITISSLPAGNYTFTVKDSRNCSATTAQATITQPAQLQLTVSDTLHTTCEWDNGILKAQASGGVAPYIYNLVVAGQENTVLQTLTLEAGNPAEFSNLRAATYRITVTDANHCSTPSNLLAIKPYTNPFVSGVAVTDVACFGGNNGRIAVTASPDATNSVQTYTLYNTASYNESNTTGVFENLFAGNYRIDVFDTNGCPSNLPYPVTVKEPQALTVTVDTVVAVAAKGTREGQIVFTITGGNESRKTVQLLNAENAVVDSLSGINNRPLSFSVGAGSYQIAVTDAQGCTFTTGLLQVEEPETPLRLTVKNVEDALCKSQTGSIEVEGIGGWGGYRYKRGVEQQFSTIRQYNNLYPGNYVITVIDSRGATYSETITVNEPQDSLKAAVITKTLPTCGNTGSLSIRLSGGTAPYKLYNADKTDSIAAAQPKTVNWENLKAGNNIFYLIDANGCRFDLETELPDTALLKIDRMEITYPTQPNKSDGAIRATIKGGVTPYIYQWKKNFTTDPSPNSPSSPTITNLPAGYYTLKVTDKAGCSAEQTLYLNDPGDQPLTLVAITHETALFAANGTAVLTAENPTTFLQYELVSPQQTLKTYAATDTDNQFVVRNDTIFLSNLASGNWFLSGIDTAGKRSVAEWTINPYPAFTFTATRIHHVTKPGGSNGTVQVEVQGGGGNNRFTWTDTANGQILTSTDDEQNSRLTGLPAGIYNVQVTDCYGNQITQNLEVLEPAEALTLSIAEQQNQSCKDNQDAYVILAAKGGWGDYQFRHHTQTYFNNNNIHTELATGEHWFYAVDKSGTTDSLKVTVIEPEYVQAAVARMDSVTCKGSIDGKVQFTITGGTAPYFFRNTETNIWTQGNETSGLIAGSHTFLFKDSNDCQGQEPVIVYVPEPDSLLFENIQVTHTTCNQDNGQIAVQLKGGTRPYRYSWVDANNMEIGADSVVSNLLQNGVYRLFVTDAKGCTQYFEQQINPSTLPVILNVETTNVFCYGESNGTARVTQVQPATPFAPYTLTWSNGDTGESSNRFPAGQHSVTIRDENGCSSIYYFDIAQPDSLRFRLTELKEPHCFGYSDGFIHTEALGGAGNYTYLWSTGATTAHLDSILKGDYWLRITDSNGCTYEKSIFIDEPAYQTVDLGDDVLMCPGNSVVIDGRDYTAYRWFTQEKGTISNERYLTVSEEGKYFLEATNTDGCSVWGDISVAIGNNALVADLLLPSEAYVGDTLIVFELSNMVLDSLRWNYDPAVFERLELPEEYRELPYALALNCLKEGIYNIELLAYSGGCISPAVKQVEILIGEARDPNDNWGQVEPLLKVVNPYPNPSKGIFTVDIALREKSDVKLALFEVASGICVHQRTESGADEYKVNYNLQGLNTGVYVLIVTAGNERKQMKLIIE